MTKGITRTPEMAEKLVEWVSSGQTVRQFCRENDIKKSAYYRWLEADAEFAARMKQARDLGYAEILEQCLEIADTPQEGIETISKVTGLEEKRGDMLGHRKLQIETRLKLLAKWDPKRFGERLEVEAGADLASAIIAARRRSGRATE